MRRGLVCVLLAGAVSIVVPSVAEASCAGPAMTVDRSSVAPGDTFVISGSGFGTDCNDDGGDGPALGTPQVGILLWLEGGPDPIPLVSINASCDYGFAARVQMPRELHAGPARITVEGGAVEPVDIEVLAPMHSVERTGPEVLAGRSSSTGASTCGRAGRTVGWLVVVVVVAVAAHQVGRRSSRRRQPV